MSEHCTKPRHAFDPTVPNGEERYLAWHVDKHSSLYACNLDQMEYVRTQWGWRPVAFMELTGRNLVVDLGHEKLMTKTWERLDPRGEGSSSAQMEMQWWIAKLIGIPMFVVLYDLRDKKPPRFAVHAMGGGDWLIMEEHEYVAFLKQLHDDGERFWAGYYAKEQHEQ